MVLLISMPWPYYTMPSIQISTLKSYLNSKGIDAHCSHIHLEVANWMGFNNYNKIADEFLEDGESLYGYMLFPEMRESIINSQSLLKKKLSMTIDNEQVLIPSKKFFEKFDEFHTSIILKLNLKQINLIGFTLNFGQTVPSLYFAKKIKELFPDKKVIIGGAEASGKLGISLLENFPHIDYVCNGEGEIPLYELAMQLNQKIDLPIKGIISQNDLKFGQVAITFNQLDSLSNLPCPDFEEYFQIIDSKLNGNFTICTSLPIESSRGCYFNCSFCALNLQWENFRIVPKEDVVNNIINLSNKFKTLEFFFVDNITPTKINQLCDEIIGLNLPFNFFYETRANLPKMHFQKLKEAGTNKVQLGIEAFSTSLLKKFDKKTTALHNLQGLKNCYENEIKVVGNLISEYPFTETYEIVETIKNIELAFAYPPSLGFSTFALEVGSPDFNNAVDKGIIVNGNYDLYKRVYPEKLFNSLFLPRKDFTVKDHELISWDSVQTALDQWSESYHYMKLKYGYNTKPLTYKDGKNFLLIEDYRYKRKDMYKFTERIERDIYINSDQVININTLYEKFKEYSKIQINKTIEEFVKHKLMAVENNYILALAIKFE